jgi:hypothetical protein
MVKLIDHARSRLGLRQHCFHIPFPLYSEMMEMSLGQCSICQHNCETISSLCFSLILLLRQPYCTSVSPKFTALLEASGSGDERR